MAVPQPKRFEDIESSEKCTTLSGRRRVTQDPTGDKDTRQQRPREQPRRSARQDRRTRTREQQASTDNLGLNLVKTHPPQEHDPRVLTPTSGGRRGTTSMDQVPGAICPPVTQTLSLSIHPANDGAPKCRFDLSKGDFNWCLSFQGEITKRTVQKVQVPNLSPSLCRFPSFSKEGLGVVCRTNLRRLGQSFLVDLFVRFNRTLQTNTPRQ